MPARPDFGFPFESLLRIAVETWSAGGLPVVRGRLGCREAGLPSGRLSLTVEEAQAGHNQRVTLSYDGYGFAGFQAQDKDKGRTIQAEVEAALQRLHAGASIRIEGSGRTDQGVHALGQVISFRAPRLWPENEMARALNSTLPRDIRAMASSTSPPIFTRDDPRCRSTTGISSTSARRSMR